MEDINCILLVEKLRTCQIVRPKNSLGTCGFYPKTWSCIRLDGRCKNDQKSIISQFLACNNNWSHADIIGVEFE